MRVEEVAKGVLAGNVRSVARAITIVEGGGAEARKLIALIYPYTGKAHVIGVTGPSGSGKSTLIGKIVREYRLRGKTVGVVAVDPTSPFTGGAFLGDRVRMQELSTDPGVFIRSMATRNHSGGLAKATRDVVKILDAAGKDVVIVETVGAGQSEVEIAKVADTVVVVYAPGLGDEIQAIKAGMTEIADVFVVNKADRENADRAVMDIRAMLQLEGEVEGWKPPILKTVALTGEGVQRLIDEVEEHKKFLKGGFGRRKIQEKVEAELIEALTEGFVRSVIEELKQEGKLEELLERMLMKEIDPVTTAERLLREKFKLTLS